MTSQVEIEVTVLDYVENIAVPGNVFQKPANEYWALICLHEGMEFLYRQSKRCDEAATQVENPAGNLRVVAYGNVPTFSQIPKGLLTCAFHWYAISACQYVRTVGAIAHKADPARPLPHEYASRVIPEVVAFRDKVAAHFSWTTINRKDNDAERAISVMPPLCFVDDSFHVGTFVATIRKGDKVSDSSAIKQWSLCKVHEALRQRYWPETTTARSKVVPTSLSDAW
ncbi:MAG: hypothetical protein AB7I48_03330 [Planctomycetaceae bacterium]